ncbi:delta-like protein B [Hyalella azteca]|uniref:Delta-like protein n=1 Tax=Hyalella azteca TaxID=294128 RepID=A0A8B7NEE7_HYAAZ|nr:delta-like protein B [Hyalella azteca]
MRRLAFAVISFLLLSYSQQVASNAMFELQLKKFVNLNGYNYQGHCCSGFRDTNGRCSEKCLTKFRVCLKVYQEVIDYRSPCTFGEIKTPILGENEIDFSVVQADGFLNPLQFSLESWQDTFSLIIEAWHDNNGTSSYAGPVLVHRFMTQRSLEVNSEWSAHEESAAHSSLSYQFRVVCQDNYFGKGCRKWCRPRDDAFGHYVCDAHGNVQCLEGWQNPEQYCIKPICSAGCHSVNGFCEKPNECQCHLGWMGKSCDECKIYPGCDHGSCNSPWECTCDEGWGGLFCNQDLNYCTNHKPCTNGATCFNTKPGSYSCLCPPGFSGTNCEVTNHTCATDPCLNGGTCLDTGDDGFVCQCPTGYTGQYCHISGKTCADRPCLNYGACLDTKSGFQCHCPLGFEGETCQVAVNECDSNPCYNGGSCVDEHASFTCVCSPGFTGKQCETNINDCIQKPCLNNGVCVDGINAFKCQCPTGYFGHLCENVEDVCANMPCANGGSCFPTSDAFTKFSCRCRPGWGGRLCNQRAMHISPCESSPCQNGGTCSEAPELSNGYRCTCLHGLIGPQCTVPIPNYDHLSEAQARVDMSSGQIVLIVIFSVAVPVLAISFVVAIICMKRRRKMERSKQDEEARRQNEQNLIHNAVNNKCLENHMIFNSLDYPVKPINTDSQYKQIAATHYPKSYMSGDSNSQQLSPTYEECPKKAIENAYSIAPARSTKTLNTDSSRLSLASRLEKDLDAACGRRVYDECGNNSYCKTPDHTSSANYTPAPLGSSSGSRSSSVVAQQPPDQRTHLSNNTLNSTCSPSTCTTPSSVYVIEEHYEDDYFATQV